MNLFLLSCNFLAANFVLMRGSHLIKLIDFDGIMARQRYFTGEYQPYEHLEVRFYRNTQFQIF